MEYTETNFKPASTRALLRQQLEEQHELCDMTVRHGTWVCSCTFLTKYLQFQYEKKTEQ